VSQGAEAGGGGEEEEQEEEVLTSRLAFFTKPWSVALKARHRASIGSWLKHSCCARWTWRWLAA